MISEPISQRQYYVRFAFRLAVMILAILWISVIMGAYKRVYMSPATHIEAPHQVGPAEDNWGPVCFMEPSATENGFEIIRYKMLSDHDNMLGFEVPCPS